jgi:hypothetical protein
VLEDGGALLAVEVLLVGFGQARVQGVLELRSFKPRFPFEVR